MTHTLASEYTSIAMVRCKLSTEGDGVTPRYIKSGSQRRRALKKRAPSLFRKGFELAALTGADVVVGVRELGATTMEFRRFVRVADQTARAPKPVPVESPCKAQTYPAADPSQSSVQTMVTYDLPEGPCVITWSEGDLAQFLESEGDIPALNQ